MSNKKAFVLRIDPVKMEALEKWAADEFRSTNGQIEWIIDQALRKRADGNPASLLKQVLIPDEHQDG